VQVNNGLALRVLKGANDAPWRFLCGNKHARAIAVQDELQFEAAGGVISGLPYVFGMERQSFQDGRGNRHRQCRQLINNRVGKQGCRIEAISDTWANEQTVEGDRFRVWFTASRIAGFKSQAIRLAIIPASHRACKEENFIRIWIYDITIPRASSVITKQRSSEGFPVYR
jgi:hypothetical protein